MNTRDKAFLEQFKRQERAIALRYSDDPQRAKEKILELHRAHNFEPGKIMAKSALKKTAVLALGLAVWYTIHSPPQNTAAIEERYQLPAQIMVQDSSIPYTTDSNGNKMVQVKDIDFSADQIDIITDRYHFVKDKDWGVVRYIGQVLSVVPKLYFWNHNIGWGADADRTRAVLAMVEGDKNIKGGITIRVNKSAPLTDLYRLFNEPVLVERNPLMARLTLGVIDVAIGGIKSKFVRGDCYNPFTRTAVIYSNIEASPAHEMGHDVDYRRFDCDWIYSISRPLPPVMLYQEWRASQNAKAVMSEQDGWQFNRYLIPAFFTYVMLSFGMAKKGVNKMREDQERLNEQLRR